MAIKAWQGALDGATFYNTAPATAYSFNLKKDMSDQRDWVVLGTLTRPHVAHVSISLGPAAPAHEPTFGLCRGDKGEISVGGRELHTAVCLLTRHRRYVLKNVILI